MAVITKDHVEPHDWVGLQRKLTIEGCSDSQYVMVFCINASPIFLNQIREIWFVVFCENVVVLV